MSLWRSYVFMLLAGHLRQWIYLSQWNEGEAIPFPVPNHLKVLQIAQFEGHLNKTFYRLLANLNTMEVFSLKQN